MATQLATIDDGGVDALDYFNEEVAVEELDDFLDDVEMEDFTLDDAKAYIEAGPRILRVDLRPAGMNRWGYLRELTAEERDPYQRQGKLRMFKDDDLGDYSELDMRSMPKNVSIKLLQDTWCDKDGNLIYQGGRGYQMLKALGGKVIDLMSAESRKHSGLDGSGAKKAAKG